jgi:hypothetical protein
LVEFGRNVPLRCLIADGSQVIPRSTTGMPVMTDTTMQTALVARGCVVVPLEGSTARNTKQRHFHPGEAVTLPIGEIRRLQRLGFLARRGERRVPTSGGGVQVPVNFKRRKMLGKLVSIATDLRGFWIILPLR